MQTKIAETASARSVSRCALYNNPATYHNPHNMAIPLQALNWLQAAYRKYKLTYQEPPTINRVNRDLGLSKLV